MDVMQVVDVEVEKVVVEEEVEVEVYDLEPPVLHGPGHLAGRPGDGGGPAPPPPGIVPPPQVHARPLPAPPPPLHPPLMEMVLLIDKGLLG